MENTLDFVLSSNFFEELAKITSYALTDTEKEKVIKAFKSFQDKLQSLSSANLQKLAKESESTQFKKVLCKHEGRTCAQNAIRGFVKAFLSGIGVKYAIDVLPAILTLRIFKKPSILLSFFKKDTIQFASFLSVSIGLYKSLLCLLRHLRKDSCDDGDWLNSFVAALLSSAVAINFDKNRNRRFTLLLYTLTRSIQFSLSFAYNKWYENRAERIRNSQALSRTKSMPVLRKTESLKLTKVEPEGKEGVVEFIDRMLRKHMPVFLMSGASAVIVYIFLNESHILPKSYYRFLNQYSGLYRVHPDHPNGTLPALSQSIKDDLAHTDAFDSRILSGSTSAEKLATIPYTSRLVEKMNPSLKHDWVQCAILHPSVESCYIAPFKWVYEAASHSFKIYFFLNAISTAIFRRRDIINNPLGLAVRVLKSSLRSSLFFGSIVSIAVSVPCLMRKIFGKELSISYYLNGILAGGSVLVESEPRRMEMAMYLAMRALELVWIKYLRSINKKSHPLLENAAFSLSLAVLMALYQNDPGRLNNMFRSILTRVFGKN